MGLITLAELRTELAAASQRTVSNTRVDRWVNDSIKEIGYGLKFHEFEDVVDFDTIDGTFQYRIGAALEIPITDFRAIHDDGLYVLETEDYIGRLIPETRSQYMQRVNLLDSTVRSNPTHYHKYGSSIYLRPVPFATVLTIQMHYWKSIPSISLVGDVSPLHEDWDDCILLGALYRLFRGVGEYPRYMTTRNDFLSLLRTRSTEMELEPFPEGGISSIGPDDGEETFAIGPA